MVKENQQWRKFLPCNYNVVSLLNNNWKPRKEVHSWKKSFRNIMLTDTKRMVETFSIYKASRGVALSWNACNTVSS
jgi:hypothetical protein